jgi:CRISPR-associated exonuclease, Cas4 family
MVNGTLVWYSYICERQVWLIGNGIEPPQDNPLLEKGRAIHEIFYPEFGKEFVIDNAIRIDLVAGNQMIAEIKSSSKHLKSAEMQLAFYLYYFKKEKHVILKGKIRIPTEKKTFYVELTEDLEREIEERIRIIENILSLPNPPKPVRIKYCKKCAYKEICWV